MKLRIKTATKNTKLVRMTEELRELISSSDSWKEFFSDEFYARYGENREFAELED